MTIVVEISNIKWQNDQDYSIAYNHGSGRTVVFDINEEDINDVLCLGESIKDFVEIETGFRPEIFQLASIEEV